MRPVRPPILLTKLVTPWVYLLIPEPAEDDTRERPSDAFEVAAEAVSFAFEAPSEAFCVASAVVEAFRNAVRRNINRDCRITARDAGSDILKEKWPATRSRYRITSGNGRYRKQLASVRVVGVS